MAYTDIDVGMRSLARNVAGMDPWTVFVNLRRLTKKQRAEQIIAMRSVTDGAVILHNLNTDEDDCYFWAIDAKREVTIHHVDRPIIRRYRSMEDLVDAGWIMHDSELLGERAVWAKGEDGNLYGEIWD